MSQACIIDTDYPYKALAFLCIQLWHLMSYCVSFIFFLCLLRSFWMEIPFLHTLLTVSHFAFLSNCIISWCLLFCFISVQGSFLLFLVQFYFSTLLSLCTPFYYNHFSSSFLLFWLVYLYFTLHVCIQRAANRLCTTNTLKLRNKFDYPDKIGSRIYSVPGTQYGENRLKVKNFFLNC